MAFLSSAILLRVVQVLGGLTAAALIGSLRIMSVEIPVGLAYLTVAVFALSWYSMLLGVSFTRLSSPQHLPRMLLAAISIIINAMIFLNLSFAIGSFGSDLADPDSTVNEGGFQNNATIKSAEIASLVLASMSSGLAFLHLSIDLVRMLQDATQLSLRMSNQNFQEVHQFDHA